MISIHTQNEETSKRRLSIGWTSIQDTNTNSFHLSNQFDDLNHFQKPFYPKNFLGVLISTCIQTSTCQSDYRDPKADIVYRQSRKRIETGNMFGIVPSSCLRRYCTRKTFCLFRVDRKWSNEFRSAHTLYMEQLRSGRPADNKVAGRAVTCEER